jgi:hypothetical protein
MSYIDTYHICIAYAIKTCKLNGMADKKFVLTASDYAKEVAELLFDAKVSGYKYRLRFVTDYYIGKKTLSSVSFGDGVTWSYKVVHVPSDAGFLEKEIVRNAYTAEETETGGRKLVELRTADGRHVGYDAEREEFVI